MRLSHEVKSLDILPNDLVLLVLKFLHDVETYEPGCAGYDFKDFTNESQFPGYFINLNKSLRHSIICNMNAVGISFINCAFTGSSVSYTKFNHGCFHMCKLNDTYVIASDFMNSEVRSATLESARVAYSNFGKSIMNDTNFKHSSIHRTNFTGASLFRSDFSSSNLTECVFRNCNMSDANFEGAILNGVDMSLANLCGVNLHGATIVNSIIARADVYMVDFTNVNIDNVDWAGTDVSTIFIGGSDLLKIMESRVY